jgi:two-component system, LytTR family, sensor kinase
MTSLNIAVAVNFLGFTVGAVLYIMLLLMVLANPRPLPSRGIISTIKLNWLLFVTGLLGLLWNLGALVIYGFAEPQTLHIPLIGSVSFTALGFLPAVVVHSTLRQGERLSAVGNSITLFAYGLSLLAAYLHFRAAFVFGETPSETALKILTGGFLLLILVIFILTRWRQRWGRASWAMALAVFAVSALHLGNHSGEDAWPVELVGHHASLPLAVAILSQEYRFAFADLFLKRAISLLVLVFLTFGLYMGVLSPLLFSSGRDEHSSMLGMGLLLGLWITTALIYPTLYLVVGKIVDKVFLGRSDYDDLRSKITRVISSKESVEDMLDDVAKALTPALTADYIKWRRYESVDQSDVPAQDDYVTVLRQSLDSSAEVVVPTAEPPRYVFRIGNLTGGRRLLSDDITMLNWVALSVARRVDLLRVTHERCVQNLREQEMSKLATEAHLRALRAQINPHFLFNSLTTIGHLINTAPDRAFDTLMRLTELLRGVLRSTSEFSTLGEEMKLIESYLNIERARFEERLQVKIDVPETLMGLRLPSLIIQPLVENAVKHGISQSKHGGELIITARMEEDQNHVENTILLSVRDSGTSASEEQFAAGRQNGLGLLNVEQRLQSYYGKEGSLEIQTTPGVGTTVEIRLPLSAAMRDDHQNPLELRREQRRPA